MVEGIIRFGPRRTRGSAGEESEGESNVPANAIAGAATAAAFRVVAGSAIVSINGGSGSMQTDCRGLRIVSRRLRRSNRVACGVDVAVGAGKSSGVADADFDISMLRSSAIISRSMRHVEGLASASAGGAAVAGVGPTRARRPRRRRASFDVQSIAARRPTGSITPHEMSWPTAHAASRKMTRRGAMATR